MSHTPLVIDRVYNADINTVWAALTDNEQMKQWYFKLDAFVPEVGFEFSFWGGDATTQYLHKCRVTEVIPGRKIAYTWRYDGYPGSSEVSFELFEEGTRTRLKLTHSGLETFPSTDPNFARSSFEAGWTAITGTSLREFVERTA